jgi:hypothetical protein
VKINLKSLLKTAVRAAKANPEIAFAVAGVIAPGLVKKIAPIVVAAAVKR